MTNLELILNMLAEESTTQISRSKKPENFEGNKKVAGDGCGVAGKAREEIEKKTGKLVISSQKFLK